jgi:amino acid transporter
MRAREYFTLAFGSIVGAGWMVVLNDWLARGGSAGAMIAFLVGGVALVPVVYVYGRLARRMPEAASEVAYTAAVFPRGVSFATGWAMTLAYVIVCPYEAVAIGRIASYVFPQINTLELYRVDGHPVYLPHLVLGVGTTLAITLINYRGIRFSTVFQNATTFGLLAVFAVFATLGLWRGDPANLWPFFAKDWEAGQTYLRVQVLALQAFASPGGAATVLPQAPAALALAARDAFAVDLWGAVLSTLAVLQVVPYFMTGFETIPKCSEEAAADFEPGRFLGVMFLALGVGTFFYVTVIAVVALLQPWPELTQTEFATAVAFEKTFGWPWLVQLIMAGVVLSLLKVFNGNFLAATRLLYAMGRRDLIGARLGEVGERYRTPTAAIALVGSVTLLASLLGRAVLVPISEVGSLACALGWLATSLAFTCGAAGPLRRGARLVGLVGAVVSAALVAIAVAGFGWFHVLTLAGWAGLGLALWLRQRGSRMVGR